MNTEIVLFFEMYYMYDQLYFRMLKTVLSEFANTWPLRQASA